MRKFVTSLAVLAIAIAAGSPAFAKKKGGSPTRVEQVAEQPVKKRGCSKGGFRSRSGGSGAAYWSSVGGQGGCSQ